MKTHTTAVAALAVLPHLLVAPLASAFVPASAFSDAASAAHHGSSTKLYLNDFFKKFGQTPEPEVVAPPPPPPPPPPAPAPVASISSLVTKIEDLTGIDLDNLSVAVKENIKSGDVGERGEAYVVAQFSLLLFIALGTVPVVGDALSFTLGPGLVGVGLVIVYKAAVDLGTNLSPWPTPADPSTGRGSLVDTGVYSLMRHPMYSGLIFGMTGLSVATDSALRLLLTAALYLVLDAKADYEECKLMETYGNEYIMYMLKVQDKIIPFSLLSVGGNGDGFDAATEVREWVEEKKKENAAKKKMEED
jgi:protein-S-isoprenylcysteine O-methyltransferase Ste14